MRAVIAVVALWTLLSAFVVTVDPDLEVTWLENLAQCMFATAGLAAFVAVCFAVFSWGFR
jgi:uncharacterized membrane protein YwaF